MLGATYGIHKGVNLGVKFAKPLAIRGLLLESIESGWVFCAGSTETINGREPTCKADAFVRAVIRLLCENGRKEYGNGVWRKMWEMSPLALESCRGVSSCWHRFVNYSLVFELHMCTAGTRDRPWHRNVRHIWPDSWLKILCNLQECSPDDCDDGKVPATDRYLLFHDC
jgi:hypothetical protein